MGALEKSFSRYFRFAAWVFLILTGLSIIVTLWTASVYYQQFFGRDLMGTLVIVLQGALNAFLLFTASKILYFFDALTFWFDDLWKRNEDTRRIVRSERQQQS